MADEDKQEEGKRKLPLVKILLLVVLVLLVLVGAIGATLFFTGYFDQKDEKTAEAQLEQASQQAKQGGTPGAADAAAGGAGGAPQRVTKTSPEITRFEYRYHEYERELLANLTSSRKVMQVQVAFMTRYDDRVIGNLKKHEFALRSVALDVMRQTTEADLDKPDFRKLLSDRLRTELNAVLEKFEDFGGIEEVYFTSFVVQ
jgi:flagellar FliL protein